MRLCSFDWTIRWLSSSVEAKTRPVKLFVVYAPVTFGGFAFHPMLGRSAGFSNGEGVVRGKWIMSVYGLALSSKRLPPSLHEDGLSQSSACIHFNNSSD